MKTNKLTNILLTIVFISALLIPASYLIFESMKIEFGIIEGLLIEAIIVYKSFKIWENA